MTTRRRRAIAVRAGLAAALTALAACDGPQSVLSPAGDDASQLTTLFWVMLVGAVVLWTAMNGFFFWITRIRTGEMSRKWAEALIIGGGILFPVVVLTALLSYGLTIMPDQRAPGDGLRVRITGEQWWWRVEYWSEGADAPVVSANELRLPAGLRSDIELTAARVIHSFWVPALGGKMDMFPGRVTETSLAPHTPGTYRGQCAEFCGLSHALMAFRAVVLPEDEFDAWLAREAEDSAAPPGPGRDVFMAEGCGACHTVRGTEAAGQVGPDLTHVGSRQSLAAGILPMTSDALVDWIADPEAFKPGVEMPGYDHLPQEDMMALARWLEGLK
ncbi:c-type cytochrome [Mesobaculum littorinae]|uniref:C-type cytochrome n=1 Tax=Mesobaculum littorinae TaxID=2486419 RepID=A0A438ADP2_9RHOB|nr:cytochrome c oxidase subunit II [Mesobaculum littorinae]RVV96787.1 c-type cytochrome [Mesobaculum littorinae]